MPELPDVCVYVASLEQRLVGHQLRQARIISPFVLRSVDPPIDAFQGRSVETVQRMGKRIVLAFEDELFLVFHLMIAGRFRWLDPPKKPPGKIALALFEFDHGSLAITEAAKQKRAALYTARGKSDLARHDPGGLDVLACSFEEFRKALQFRNRTIKRALTDPYTLDGIGNAYSDEILHAAKMAPTKRTRSMTDLEIETLHKASRDTLNFWIQELRTQFTDRFPGPGDITAFRDGFAVHGKFEQPCPACKTPVQRIRLADSEHNYCPKCQTGGKVLRDRSLSRLLKDDWPSSIDEL